MKDNYSFMGIIWDWNDNGNEIDDKLEGKLLGRAAEATDGIKIYSALHS